MNKTATINVRVDGELKEQAEKIMAEFGLNMTTTVNMLLKQIVRENSIPLSLSLNPDSKLRDDLIFAQLERIAGYKGTSGDAITEKMNAIIAEAQNGKGKYIIS